MNGFSNYKIIEIDNDYHKIILDELLRNHLVLIAYDCDANFEPCNKLGFKAHWALITGLLIPLNKNESQYLVDKYSDSFDRELDIIYKNDTQIEEELNKFISKDAPCYCICKNGKSKHSGIWPLNKLLQSNQQLAQIDRDKCDPNEFIWPLNGDIQKTLASKILVFYKQ
jgi:hypothetical protein